MKRIKMKAFFLMAIVMLHFSFSIGQNFGDCGNLADTTNRYQLSRMYDNTSNTWLDEYRTPGHWIPDGTTPVKTILVNWIICRDDNGGNGWQDCQEFRNQVSLMFERINQVYSNSLPKGYSLTCEPQYPYIVDSKIRFELNDIIFLDNTQFNQCSLYSSSTIGLILDYLYENYPSSRHALNHIFAQPYNPPQPWGRYDVYGDNSFVITNKSMYHPTFVVWDEHVAHITHEYGHAVGLHHTYDGEITCTTHYDFLNDVFGECPENIFPCTHDYLSCDGENVCYLPKVWFENNFKTPYPLMSGSMIQPRYISPKCMGRMHRDLSLFDNDFLVPNKPMHKYVKEKYSYNVPLTITSNETWDFAIKMYQDIVITDNTTLTIAGEVKMPIDGKIIVQPGARLIIDGGKITSAHEQLWTGIEVWGNSSTHQHEVNGNYLQGYVELKNGAVIENAKCALNLWRPNYWNSTGGIVHATDATFRNNVRAVHALWYTYSPSGRLSDYNAYFHNCTFTIDEDYLGTESFYKHVDLSHVNGIDFLGCSFSADRQLDSVSSYCVGIGAYSAGFRVDSYCENPNAVPCPETYLVPSCFGGFHRGIHASNDGSTAYGFRVENSVFNNNTCGIYALNTGWGIVVNNDFTVGCGWDCDYGIYADGVSGFCFEDNVFRPKVINYGSPYGIVIVNSEGINDVYNNDFSNLRCGNVAIGTNTGGSEASNDVISGLTYTCNTNTGNLIDFCVLKDGNIGAIAQQQGSAALPAGNTFSGSQYHFYNDGNQQIGYWYRSNSVGQMPTLLYGVGANGTNNTNSCQSHYAGGSVVKSASEKAELEANYLSALSTYNNLLQLYESRIDGGSTSTQVADISSATPSDMWSLRAQLLGISPYVSGEVLTTAADRYDVFTDPVLFEILAANPDELKKDSLISYLENKEHPLPAYMTDLLRQMASGFTVRTALLAQMAQYNHDYSLAAGDIVRSILNDSTASASELRTWLGNMGDITSDRMIVASYLQEGDSIHAFALANMLPELYGLQGDALADHSDYMRLIGLYQTLYREGRTVFELTNLEAAMVDSIAEWGTGTSKAMAGAMLMERSDDYVRVSDCPTMPENNGRNMGSNDNWDNSLNRALGFNVIVSPNPATTWTTMDYTLPNRMSKATVTFTNTLGITVMSAELNGNQGQKVLDLSGLDSGVYVYTVHCGEFITTGKLIITK